MRPSPNIFYIKSDIRYYLLVEGKVSFEADAPKSNSRALVLVATGLECPSI
jgi:hypothetical protein